MAHLYDSSDILLGGLHSLRGLRAYAPATPEAIPRTRLNPKFGSEEIVPGLECSYGSFAYSYGPFSHDPFPRHSRLHGCHNPVETPKERHHCDFCGGDYCSVHAERAAHDCSNVVLPA
ncbi:MAG: AN1-type zinc finger domain-containing protein [Armatimonadetes bacterium]|nr:AN1-type zinc finger domain-containing protein [Armatimonadota bacterium]